MAFIPALNTLRVFIEFEMPSGARVGNVLWFRDTTGQPTSGRQLALALVLEDWFDSDAKAQVAQDVDLVRITMRDMTEAEGDVLDYIVTPAIAGTNASNAVAAHTTIAVKLTTGQAGRSKRGRLYHVGLSEAAVVGDSVDSSFAAAMLANYVALREDFVADIDFQWVIASFVSGGSPRETALLTPITGISLHDLRVDTQRRRLVGEGT